MRLAPQWALRRARARAAHAAFIAQQELDCRYPEVRYIGGERWRRRGPTGAWQWELEPHDGRRRS
jgi:hypothetical protein